MQVERTSLPDRIRRAGTCPWAEGLPQECLEDVLRDASLLRSAPNESLVASGTTPNGHFLLVEGGLLLDASPYPWCMSSPHDLLHQTNQVGSLQSGSTGSLVFFLPRMNFLDLLERQPRWSVRLAELSP
ncbi:MAG: hypothetical protein H6686_11950 [Fibrobacteria bacterium]|nr:hypothetical protein [Fibrobacteria bacterium]